MEPTLQLEEAGKQQRKKKGFLISTNARFVGLFPSPPLLSSSSFLAVSSLTLLLSILLTHAHSLSTLYTYARSLTHSITHSLTMDTQH